jgi:tetratricopeptide (TPR) repeat protein
MRTLVVAFAALLFSSCASTALDLEGAESLDTARTYLEMGRFGEAADLAGDIVRDSAMGAQHRAEAAFVAGEAELGQGEHLNAFRHYQYLLESAPFSPHSAVIQDRLFEIGQAFFHDEEYDGWFGDRARGVEVFGTYQTYFRRTDRADDALRLIADYYAADGEWEEAAFTYDRLLEEYPGSEWIEESLWRSGWCRLQLNQGPEYDRDELLRAKERLDLSLARFPRGMAANKAREDLQLVRERLGRGEIGVADFYRGRGIWEGERLRLANAYLLYGDTAAGAEARERLLARDVDLATLERDPRLNSVDNMKPGRPPWNKR